MHLSRQPHKRQQGFTIVELLIVIVVIAILAAITLVAYNGMQARARDSRRQNDVATIAKALELYYIDNGHYPLGGQGASTAMTSNPNWITTADSSWSILADALRPYLTHLPADPVSTPGVDLRSSSGYDYAYFSNDSQSWCGVSAPQQMYLLVFKTEGASQTNTLKGPCTSTVVGPYAGTSNFRVVK